MVDELVKGAVDMPDSIDRIYRWVQREIHYISIKGSVASGETGHPAQFTFEQKYGDCSDVSILLCTMLHQIGVESYPIVLMTNDEEEVTRDIPDISGNHAISMAIIDGKRYFLDATSTTHVFPYFRGDDAGVTYVCALCRDWGIVYVPTPEDNAKHIDMTMNLDREGTLSMDYVSSLIGDYEANFRGYWEYQPEDQRELIVADWAGYLVDGAELRSWELTGLDDLSTDFHERFSLVASNYPSVAADLWIVAIPEIQGEYNFEEVSLAERFYPIEYTSPKQYSHTVSIELPEGAELIYIPKPIKLNNSYASYDASYRMDGDSKVVFEDIYRLKKRVVPPEDYGEYKAFCESISGFTRERIFVRVGN